MAIWSDRLSSPDAEAEAGVPDDEGGDVSLGETVPVDPARPIPEADVPDEPLEFLLLVVNSVGNGVVVACSPGE